MPSQNAGLATTLAEIHTSPPETGAVTAAPAPTAAPGAGTTTVAAAGGVTTTAAGGGGGGVGTAARSSIITVVVVPPEQAPQNVKQHARDDGEEEEAKQEPTSSDANGHGGARGHDGVRGPAPRGEDGRRGEEPAAVDGRGDGHGGSHVDVGVAPDLRARARRRGSGARPAERLPAHTPAALRGIRGQSGREDERSGGDENGEVLQGLGDQRRGGGGGEGRRRRQLGQGVSGFPRVDDLCLVAEHQACLVLNSLLRRRLLTEASSQRQTWRSARANAARLTPSMVTDQRRGRKECRAEC
eukprot:TRINITY_DN4218_c0_g1_i1.p1 TRINITY_DN4218_c0_g1~~TRINITY_DN4218_c0_g1_i1.p1  ORF type:complete len:299 (+),score=-24.76 TRINITY_DN4218_c0_g1_i1:389-1285(+)